MAITFNARSWKLKERQRFEAREAAGKPTNDDDLDRSLDCINSIRTVVNWCAGKDINVVFNGLPNGSYDVMRRVIEINMNALPELQLHYLLHECGHALVDESVERGEYESTRWTGDINVIRSTRYRVGIVDEEYEAWKRGLRLVKRLNVSINRATWDRTRAQCIKQHMKWCLMVNEFAPKKPKKDVTDGKASP